MPIFGFDLTFIVLIPAMLLAMYAQSKVQRTYDTYSRVALRSNMTGAEVARTLLDNSGLHEVKIERVRGNLTDHYDPRTKVLRLSDSVYANRSIAAAGVAAHESGHAIQDKERYAPLKLRGAMVPLASVGSRFSMILFIAGLLFSETLISAGIILFSITVLFQLVTLPVEFDASNRALQVLEGYHIMEDGEVKKAKKVLDAAALTYVAAAFTGIMSLFRLLLIRNRRND